MSQPETPHPALVIRQLAEKLEARIAAGIRLDVPTREIAESCVAEVEAALLRAQQMHRRACDCAEPDPVMQADGKFYCYRCSFQTGARPRCLEPEESMRHAQQVQREQIEQDILAIPGNVMPVDAQWRDFVFRPYILAALRSQEIP